MAAVAGASTMSAAPALGKGLADKEAKRNDKRDHCGSENGSVLSQRVS